MTIAMNIKAKITLPIGDGSMGTTYLSSNHTTTANTIKIIISSNIIIHSSFFLLA